MTVAVAGGDSGGAYGDGGEKHTKGKTKNKN